MEGENYQQLRELYHELENLSEAELEEELERRDVSAKLRAELMSLFHDNAPLTAFRDDKLGDFGHRLLETERPNETDDERIGESRIGEEIGQFRITGLIGHGGMGTVYEAEQENPKRRVALKVIRPGVLSGSIIKRFEREVQILGQLQHSGIAQIYEAGHAEIGGARLPFFAMERIDGEPLDVYAGNRRLGTRQRAELIARVADAVQHAHQKGIVHRDLKPGNILVVGQQTTAPGADVSPPRSVVDSLGQPKILDFGIARVTDADIQTVTIQTDLGQFVGTLAYMSPEQVTGKSSDIDTRSDVYTLGVILYQLATGRLPYDVSDRAIPEAARIICEEDPPPASSLDASLRGDVDVIIAKAMEKERDQRYGSAAELAADIRRFLRHEPISAHPPSTMYQIRKFTKRNKGLVGGLVAAFVVLILGLAGTAKGMHDARAQRDEARLTQERLEVVVAFQAQQLSGMNPFHVGRGMMEDFRGEFLRSVEKEGLTEAARKPELDSLERVLDRLNPTNLAVEVLRSLYIDRALERLDTEFSDDPIVEADLRESLAGQCSAMGLYELVHEQRSRVLELRRQHLGPRHPETLKAISSAGATLRRMGRLAEAETFYREALEGRQDVLGENHEATLTTLHNLGGLLRHKGENEEAERISREAFDRRVKVLGEDHSRTIASMNQLGVALHNLGQTDEALIFLKRALEAWQRTKGPDDSRTILARNNVMGVLFKTNRLEEAEAIARDVLASYIRYRGDEHPDTIMALNNLGMVVFRRGNTAEAEPLFREAYELSWEHLPPTNEIRMKSTGNFVDTLLELGQPEEAETYCGELLAVRRALTPPVPVDVARSLDQLGRCLFDQGNARNAEAAFRECLDIRKQVSASHWQTHETRSLLGSCLADMQQHEEAEALLISSCKALLEQRDEIPAHERDTCLSDAVNRVVRFYESWGKPEKADEWRVIGANQKDADVD